MKLDSVVCVQPQSSSDTRGEGENPQKLVGPVSLDYEAAVRDSVSSNVEGKDQHPKMFFDLHTPWCVYTCMHTHACVCTYTCHKHKDL